VSAAEAAQAAGPAPSPGTPRRSQAEVLASLAALHQRFEDEQISFDDFESSKADLMAQLDI
jgi:hypothetical protein